MGKLAARYTDLQMADQHDQFGPGLGSDRTASTQDDNAEINQWPQRQRQRLPSQKDMGETPFHKAAARTLFIELQGTPSRVQCAQSQSRLPRHACMHAASPLCPRHNGKMARGHMAAYGIVIHAAALVSARCGLRTLDLLERLMHLRHIKHRMNRMNGEVKPGPSLHDQLLMPSKR